MRIYREPKKENTEGKVVLLEYLIIIFTLISISASWSILVNNTSPPEVE